MGNKERSYFKKTELKIAKLKLDNKVFFYEYINDVELNKLYDNCSLFICTSLGEGLSLVMLEAMAKGLPVVAYDIVGVRDIILNNKNGFLIKDRNKKNFVEKILFLYKNKSIYSIFSNNALKRVDYFNWSTSVKTLAESLKKDNL